MHGNFYSKSKKFLRKDSCGRRFSHFQYPFCRHTLGQKLTFPPINTDSFKSAFFCFSVFVNKGVELIHRKQQIAVHKFDKNSVNFLPTEKNFKFQNFFFNFFQFLAKNCPKIYLCLPCPVYQLAKIFGDFRFFLSFLWA